MGVHDGHRERMRERFYDHGLDAFQDHEVLELLLYHVHGRGDVNPLAHRLLDTFGSLAGVFDAPRDELLKVDGVGKKAAQLIHLVPELSRRYMISRTESGEQLNNTAKAGQYVKSFFYAKQEEAVYLLCLNADYRVLAMKKLSEGDVGSAGVPIRKVVEYALTYKAVGVILAHNHPSGVTRPSKEDIDATMAVKKALAGVSIPLHDHIIVGNDSYLSLADEGMLKD
ncbi:MAG: DNA repair protein RadC [Oscillospiraceae bacterium]|nr:DNA repair protein RadC [Oscillospiraceae bacterium]